MKQQITSKCEKKLSKKPVSNEKSCKVFVGGIPHNSTEAEIKEYFEKFGSVFDVEIVKNAKKNKPKGYAFVSFFSSEAAEAAIMQKEHLLRGKKMGTKRAVDPNSASQKTKNQQNMKLFAKGFPLETSERDIYDLFQQYGPIDRVLMQYHSKSGKFRGFAYILMQEYADFCKLIDLKELIYKGSIIELSASKSKGQVFKQRKENINKSSSKKAKSDKRRGSQSSGDQDDTQLVSSNRSGSHDRIPYLIESESDLRRQRRTPRLNIAVYNDEEGFNSEQISNMRIGDHNIIWRPPTNINSVLPQSRVNTSVVPLGERNLQTRNIFDSRNTVTRTYEVDKSEEIIILSREEICRREQTDFRPSLEVSQKIVTEFFYECQDHRYKSLIEEKVHWANNGSSYVDPGNGNTSWGV